MLLDDIIELATDNKQSVTVLLRKCIVLAHQIKNEKLKSWANKELNGYANDDELPGYRVSLAQAKGNFSGWGGSAMNHWPIPPALLEPKHQRFAREVLLTQAISAYEDLVATKSKGNFSISWPTNLVLYYQERIENSKNMNLVSAYQEVTRGALVEVVDSVRTRVLNMALEIQSEIGERDEDLKRMTPQSAQRVDQTIVQQIFGGNVYVATGQSSMSVQHQTIAVGDWAQLEQALRNTGLSQLEIEELSTAVKQGDQKPMGTGVMGWIKKNAPKAISGGVKIGAAVGQTLLTEYLKQYYGLS
ncbi:MAG TPA: hypothetical protein VIH91_10885 [Terriglobales bacterium]